MNSDRDIRSATVLKRSRDMKGWLKPHIDTPKNHTNPHNFLFRLDEQQQCVMQYRNWSSDAWMPGVKPLEVCQFFLNLNLNHHVHTHALTEYTGG